MYHGNKKKSGRVLRRIRAHFRFCASICSIHGLAHVVRNNRSPYERLLWFLLVTSAAGWCIWLGTGAWDRYRTRPTVISLERDHWKWNTTFPAVTLCLNAIDDGKIDDLIASLDIPEADVDNFKEFIGVLALGDISSYKKLDKFEKDSLYARSEEYLSWVHNISLELDSSVEISQSFGDLGDFVSVFTEFGHCYVYNSRVATHNSREHSVGDLTNSRPHPIMIYPKISAPTLSIRNLICGYKIFFHSANEVADLTTKGMILESATFTTFQLTVQSVWTPGKVKTLGISQRKCRLTEESNLKYSPTVYSYNLCRIECRIDLCLSLCKCIPYYYKRLGNERICNVSGMICLTKHEAIIMRLSDKGKSLCKCIQNCDEDSVTVAKYEITEWFLGTNLLWKVKEYPTVRYRRSLIFSRIDLLVQIGGIAGLLLGCSVLSLMEILYFFSLRFYWGVIRNRAIRS